MPISVSYPVSISGTRFHHSLDEESGDVNTNGNNKKEIYFQYVNLRLENLPSNQLSFIFHLVLLF